MSLEVLSLDLFLQRLTQLPVATDHETRVGDGPYDDRGSIDQVLLSLLRHERADVADDRSMRRQIEGGMDVPSRKLDDAFDVNAFVHDGRLVPRNAVGDQALSHGFADRHEAVDASVFPFRERILCDPELDAA